MIAFVNERSKGAMRFDDATRHETLLQLLPAIRGAVSSERAKLLCIDESAKALEFVSSAAAPALVEVGAPSDLYFLSASYNAPDPTAHESRTSCADLHCALSEDCYASLERAHRLMPASLTFRRDR